jgi:hypothetical protein
MPVVSVNLSDNAYHIYKMWRNNGRSASAKVSLAISRMWNNEDAVAVLQPGDRRVSITGEELEWDGHSFQVYTGVEVIPPKELEE